MKLDEAIKHAKEVAEKNECKECAEQHRQLAEWLKELKQLREQTQESEAIQFAKWVANEIFSDMWELNKDAFDELACRKLAKLGLVRANGDEWVLVKLQESEDKENDSDYGHGNT